MDINTLYNPFTKVVDGERILEPATAGAYVDRKKNFDYKITHEDLCYKLFKEHGFEWGGDWTSVKDYQHFELKSDIVKILYPDFFWKLRICGKIKSVPLDFFEKNTFFL